MMLVVYICGMKKILSKISRLCRRWYWRHVFEKWFVFYLKKGCQPCLARSYAESVLLCKAPKFIFYEDYLDFIMQEYCGLPPCREKLDGDKRLVLPKEPVSAKDLML